MTKNCNLKEHQLAAQVYEKCTCKNQSWKGQGASLIGRRARALAGHCRTDTCYEWSYYME